MSGLSLFCTEQSNLTTEDKKVTYEDVEALKKRFVEVEAALKREASAKEAQLQELRRDAAELLALSKTIEGLDREMTTMQEGYSRIKRGLWDKASILAIFFLPFLLLPFVMLLQKEKESVIY